MGSLQLSSGSRVGDSLGQGDPREADGDPRVVGAVETGRSD